MAKVFTVTIQDTQTRARLGVLRTPHGVVHTPAYVMVATRGEVKCLKPADLKATGIQLVISNTYHLWDDAPAKAPATKQTFLTKRLGRTVPTMTDSGGFQVFSYGAAREHNVGKVLERKRRSAHEPSAVRITERGVYFTDEQGKRRFLSPEISMDIQHRLGADMIFAFDECSSPLHDYAYTRQAMERTHRWAVRSLKAHQKLNSTQLLFGIVQGGRSSRLRVQSAKYIASLPFGGVGIGGSFGKDEMQSTLARVIPHLPEDRPRHLLGIGRLTDILDAIAQGVDTFDCVIPTREARHGRIWTDRGPYDLMRGRYATSRKRLALACRCPACRTGTTQASLRALFKSKNVEAPRLATLHNVWFFNDFLAHARTAIRRGQFSEFRRKALARLAQTPQ